MEHIKRKVKKYINTLKDDTSIIYNGIPYGNYCYEDIDNTCRVYCVYCGEKCSLLNIKITGCIKLCNIHKNRGKIKWNHQQQDFI